MMKWEDEETVEVYLRSSAWTDLQRLMPEKYVSTWKFSHHENCLKCSPLNTCINICIIKCKSNYFYHESSLSTCELHVGATR